MFLLDLTSLSTPSSQATLHEAVSTRFSQIAKALLGSHHLCLSSPSHTQPILYDILELEFYLNLSRSGADGSLYTHSDPFTHASEEQRVSGRWYFHRAPAGKNGGVSKTGYRGGTRKGLDLTFGGPVESGFFASSSSGASSSTAKSTSDTRGGILLRCLRRRSDKAIISGPSLLVDEILAQSGAQSISELVEGASFWGGKTGAFGASSVGSPTLRVRRNDDSEDAEEQPVVYSSPRIGLDLSNPNVTLSLSDLRIQLIARPYRYIVHPELVTSKGKGKAAPRANAIELAVDTEKKKKNAEMHWR